MVVSPERICRTQVQLNPPGGEPAAQQRPLQAGTGPTATQNLNQTFKNHSVHFDLFLVHQKVCL